MLKKKKKNLKVHEKHPVINDKVKKHSNFVVVVVVVKL